MKTPFAILVALIGTLGCGHTMRVHLPPPDARTCQPSGHTIGVGALTLAEPAGKADPACIERRRYAKPGFGPQVRATLVSDLAATGCFQDVVDLEAAPSAKVDYVLTGNIASLEGCTRDASQEDASGSMILGAATFGLTGGAIVAADLSREAGWAEVTLDNIQLDSIAESRAIWKAGFAHGSSRNIGRAIEISPETLGDEALGSLSRDLSRKLSRVIGGNSPYGMISMETGQPEGTPEIALVTGGGATEAEALTTVPADLLRQLRPGYPAYWPADRFVARKDRPEGTVAVVGLFANTDDAIDWLMTRNPRVKGMTMLAVSPPSR
jgi:hypothetical protein